MNYSELLDRILVFPGVTDDSREVVKGGVFLVDSTRKRWRDHLADAMARGAGQFVVTKDVGQSLPLSVLVPDVVKARSELANAFYRSPSRELLLLGVTGTSGKTTTTYLIESILSSSGRKPGVIGTENIRFDGVSQTSVNTTPGSFLLQRSLRKMVDSGCDAVVMEASSHGLVQGRVDGLLFDGAVFTNLTAEHLDFHATMQGYFKSKAILFDEFAFASIQSGKTFHAAINIGCEWGALLGRRLETLTGQNYILRKFERISLEDGEKLNNEVGHGQISGIVGKTPFRSPLMGAFNEENIAGAIALAQSLGMSDAEIAQGITSVKKIPGRLERVYMGERGPAVFVDYAHKPGALQVVLSTLRRFCRGRLIVVFGCGGDRDRAKRPEMGKLALSIADVAVLTSDNNRSEDPKQIFADVISGIAIPDRNRLYEIADRREAIHGAVLQARDGDVVLIAGRGAERFLRSEVDGIPIVQEFDDREVARQCAWSAHGKG